MIVGSIEEDSEVTLVVRSAHRWQDLLPSCAVELLPSRFASSQRKLQLCFLSLLQLLHVCTFDRWLKSFACVVRKSMHTVQDKWHLIQVPISFLQWVYVIQGKTRAVVRVFDQVCPWRIGETQMVKILFDWIESAKWRTTQVCSSSQKQLSFSLVKIVSRVYSLIACQQSWK